MTLDTQSSHAAVKSDTPDVVAVGDGFFGVEGDWSLLAGKLDGCSFFLGPEWLSAWWETYGQPRQPLVFRIGSKNNPIAAVPLSLGRRRFNGLTVREIGWIGTGERVCPEHLDALGDSGKGTVVAIAKWLQQNKNVWDMVRLLDSRAGGFASFLVERLGDAGFIAKTLPCCRCPRIVLPPVYEDLIAGYSYNMRRTVRRIDRRLQKDSGYRVEWFNAEKGCSGQDIEDALDEMNRLHTLSRSAHSEQGNFIDETYRAFHARLMARTLDSGILRLAFLYHSDSEQPIAFRYGFLYNNIWIDYQTGYDTAYRKQRIGWYLLGECLRRAIAEGAAIFDMLRGDHDYKRHWATACEETETIWVFNNNLRGRLMRLALYVKPVIRKLLTLHKS
ncbi:MAG: GNAT family N-acetyltransferase [Gammaproteobacteria bacterium]